MLEMCNLNYRDIIATTSRRPHVCCFRATCHSAINYDTFSQIMFQSAETTRATESICCHTQECRD